jgi:hypothetical protein
MGVHKSYGQPYDWPLEIWAMLLAVLQPGDIIELCRNSFLRMLMPDSQGVLIWRNGENIRIDRRQLKRESLEPPKPKPAPAAKPHPKPIAAKVKVPEGEDIF